MSSKKVVIIDDSALFCELLTKQVNSLEGFEVCAVSGTAKEGIELIEKHDPDIVLLDVELPDMSGTKLLRKLIPVHPVPAIACSSHKASAAKMLAAGAVDFLSKPDPGSLESFKASLLGSMKNALLLRETTCGGVVYKLKRKTAPSMLRDNKLILIGGSAGSTDALPVILRSFTPDMPPTAVTLHMPKGYTGLYAERLRSDLGLNVTEAAEGKVLKEGDIVIARGAEHMRLHSGMDGFYVSSSEGERISGHCPSVDALFMSAAVLRKTRIIAVMLTGMGSDGAHGMLALRKSGAYTIGQDEKTSLVYGMPKAAYELGAVCRQCSLERIADNIKLKLKEWE